LEEDRGARRHQDRRAGKKQGISCNPSDQKSVQLRVFECSAFLGSKETSSVHVQIRSHAQKYFLKVQKLGLAAGLPPVHPRRRVFMEHQSSASAAAGSTAAMPLLQGSVAAMPPGPSAAAVPAANSGRGLSEL
jgi:hypothetical protein